jgi:8-oxo-dGTP pyrophosphatase MutT (NUDIX family)
MSQELLAVYTPQGTPAGYQRPRNEVHTVGLWHCTVHVWLYNGTHLLLQKRAANRQTYPGYWDISAAGHIHAAEEPLQTAVRETFEETGITISPSQCRYLGRERMYNVLHNNTFHDREFNHVYLVCQPFTLQECRLNPEVSEFGLFTPREMIALQAQHPHVMVPHPRETELIYRHLSTNVLSPSGGDT